MEHMETQAGPQVRPALLVPGGRQQQPRRADRARATGSHAGSELAVSIVAALRTISASRTTRPESTCSPAASSQTVEVGDPTASRSSRGGPGGQESTIQAPWLIDASGRSFIIKRKLGLLEANGHLVNSAWFRLAGGLDIEDWADPGDDEFFNRMSERGLRKFLDQPSLRQGLLGVDDPARVRADLESGSFADPSFHPFDSDGHAGQGARLDP